MRRTLLTSCCGLIALVALLHPSLAPAGPIYTPADWTSVATGTLDGVGFTMSGVSGKFQGIDTILVAGSDPDYAGAPLAAPSESANVEFLQYAYSNNWTVTFDQPLASGLMLYPLSWRGALTSNPDPDVGYTFSQPFTILSGMDGSSVAGNTLTLPDGKFYDGVLQFGPLTSLSVQTTNALNDSGQDLTFAVVPEPATLSLLALGSLVALRRRRR